MSFESTPMKPTQAKPEIISFFDEPTSTFSYVVRDPNTKQCAIIDSVMDIDYAAGHIHYAGADKIVAFIREKDWQVQWLIETHVHADHLSAAPYIQQQLGGQIMIGEHILTVQKTFGKIFNEGTEFARDGSQFDVLLKDGQPYQIGSMPAVAYLTAGHTPACMTHVVGDNAFVGDTLFMPDVGTARADFPGGDARQLYQSLQRILAMPDNTVLYMCHDYPPAERKTVADHSTVGQQKATNIHLCDHVSEADYVAMREARDSTLAVPKLIIPSLQVNMRAGHLPPADQDGRVFLKVPVNVLANRTE